MKSAVPTLAHVARLAKVSENTVSRVIRNKGPIAEDTRARVETAIRQLGYVPNRAAGSLASSTSPIIGVILPSLSNIVFPEVLRGIHAALNGSQYQAMVAVTDYNLIEEEKALSALLAWKPAAIITTGFQHTDASHTMLRNTGVRVAELMDIDAEPIDIAVGLSHRNAGKASAAHLLARGYRKIAYVGHDWELDIRAKHRFDGLCEALAEAGHALVASKRYNGQSSTHAGRQTMAELLCKYGKVDAVVFSNDDMAVGGYMHCLAQNLEVPGDVALFGFNGLDIGQALPKALSTIRSNRFMIGKIAAQTLLDATTSRSKPQTIDTGFEILQGQTA